MGMVTTRKRQASQRMAGVKVETFDQTRYGSIRSRRNDA